AAQRAVPRGSCRPADVPYAPRRFLQPRAPDPALYSTVVVRVVPRASAPLLLALLASCSFDAPFATDYLCGVGDSCPSGSRCVEGRCTADDGDGDASTLLPDGDAAMGGPDASTSSSDAGDAGSTVRFSDDFGDGALTGWTPWTHAGCTVMETGGAL